MSAMFLFCRNLGSLDVSNFDTSHVTNMSAMFSECSNLGSLDVSNFDTSQVTDMREMFFECNNLGSLDVSNFDTNQVTCMGNMFTRCRNLGSLDVSNFDTSRVTYMDCMFSGCSGLKNLDLSSFRMNLVSYALYMLDDCDSLERIKTPTGLKKTVNLPEKEGYIWIAPDGTEISALPCSEKSILIERVLTGSVRDVFRDVYQDWYTDYVEYVFDNGLMTGIKGTNRFEPNSRITKAQVAQVLYNMDNTPDVEDQEVFSALKDVYPSEWYADAVAWAYNNSIVTGDINAKKFFPDADVTREQLATMMYRYAKYRGDEVSSTGDLAGLKHAENVSNWALEGVRWAVGSGLISGIEKNGTKDLAPQGNATRAQMAAILQRFCEGNE